MRVLMTGGGTGGHVNPAIAIANTIREKEKDSVIAFVGTSRGIENKLVPKYGYEVYHVEIQGLKRSLSLSNIKTAFLTVTSVRKAKKLVREFKPDAVIGTGGYVCWPVVKAAASLGIPTFLHESNAIPGVAVKMLERYVDAIYTNFESTAKKLKYPEKAVRVGNPLLAGAEKLEKTEAKRRIGAEKYEKVLLSFGGSLGARTVNLNALDIAENYIKDNKNVLYLHATGSHDWEMMREEAKKRGLDALPNFQMTEYIYDMPVRMAAADLVICRAGAMTLSELAIMNKPSVLVPSPNVTDNHQFKNANELGRAGAAEVFEEKDLGEGTLRECVSSLLENDAKLESMGKAVRQFALGNANEIIYRGVREKVDARAKESK